MSQEWGDLASFWAMFGVICMSALRMAVPLLFASMGGLLSERSGVINIALEGMMLMGAFFASTVASSTSSEYVGLLVGGGAGLITAALYGLFVIRFQSDQIVAGTAINFLAMGLTPFVCKVLHGTSNATPSLELAMRFQWLPLFLGFGVVVLLAAVFKFTKWGMWIQFAGEHPQALATAGVSVLKVRWTSVLLSGFLAGIGGSSLTLFLASSFSRNMTAGRGFMAIAALILGKWRPIPTALACLFFGFADAIQIRLQGAQSASGWNIPVQWIQMLPYLVTILVLAGLMGRSRAPTALGLKFESSH